MARKSNSPQSPPLRRSVIVQAALEVLDRDGFSQLTLRRVADELTVKAPALYWHFKDKTELVDYMAEALLQTELSDLHPRREDEPWQEWLVGHMIKLRLAMWSRRDGARIVAGAHLAPAVTLVRLFDVSLESLVSAGVDMRLADMIISTATHFTFGRVIEEQSGPTPEQLEQIDIHDLFSEFPFFLKSLEQNATIGGDEFEKCLRLIIDGGTVRLKRN